MRWATQPVAARVEALSAHDARSGRATVRAPAAPSTGARGRWLLHGSLPIGRIAGRPDAELDPVEPRPGGIGQPGLGDLVHRDQDRRAVRCERVPEWVVTAATAMDRTDRYAVRAVAADRGSPDLVV